MIGSMSELNTQSGNILDAKCEVSIPDFFIKNTLLTDMPLMAWIGLQLQLLFTMYRNKSSVSLKTWDGVVPETAGYRVPVA
jgi:hypothetical protein